MKAVDRFAVALLAVLALYIGFLAADRYHASDLMALTLLWAIQAGVVGIVAAAVITLWRGR